MPRPTSSPEFSESTAKTRLGLLLPLLTMVSVMTLMGCDALTGAGPNCYGESYASGGACHEALQGIPAFPPPPCWNEAGEIQSDEICAKVHESEDDAVPDDGPGLLPGPPALP